MAAVELTSSGAAKDVSKEEPEKFVSKVAEFLRESVQRNDDWNEDTVKMAFAESVARAAEKVESEEENSREFRLILGVVSPKSLQRGGVQTARGNGSRVAQVEN